MDYKLSVVGIPVSDVDADQVGFHLDHDVRPAEGLCVVQMTPPGSACSVVIGNVDRPAALVDLPPTGRR